MSRFRNEATGVVFSVDDEKDDRYSKGGYEALPEAKPEPKKSSGKAASTSDSK
jgi:hypothetical protein